LLLALPFKALSLFPGALLRCPSSLFGGLFAGLLFFSPPQVLRLETLALAALILEPLAFESRSLFGFAALGVDLILLMARLLFEYIAFDVGALPPHLDIDGAGAALCARQLELLLGLALQRDLPRGGIAVVAAAVSAPQVRQQFELRIVADARVRSFHFDARLVELNEQPVHRHLQNFGELGNCYFCHRLCNPRAYWPASNQ
jgi:hypothetical protein